MCLRPLPHRLECFAQTPASLWPTTKYTPFIPRAVLNIGRFYSPWQCLWQVHVVDGGGGVSNTEQGLAQGCSMAATHPTPPCGAHGGLRGLIGASWATPPPQPSLPSPRVSGHRNTILRYDRGPPEEAQREAVHYKNTPVLMKLLSNTDVVPTSLCVAVGVGVGERDGGYVALHRFVVCGIWTAAPTGGVGA